MKILMVHQNFPGQYLHIARHLAKNPENCIVAISQEAHSEVPGVRRFQYKLPDLFESLKFAELKHYGKALQRAEAVAAMARKIDELGFKPDIILGHHGWGELLNLKDVWPEVPVIGYFEFYYQEFGYDVDFDMEIQGAPISKPFVRSLNVINQAALALDQFGQTPTLFQKKTYPKWCQDKIHLIEEGVDLEMCRPNKLAQFEKISFGDFSIYPSDILVTYVARNLEPYRGFHTMMRSMPKILASNKNLKVVMVGGNDVSYGNKPKHGSWKTFMENELQGNYDISRVCMPGHVPYDTYLKLLKRSNLHIYLTYPFVASWSLREALACGCTIVASDVEPVREFITDNVNGMLVKPLDPNNLADTVIGLLSEGSHTLRLQKNARYYAEENLDMRKYLKKYEAFIHECKNKN